MGGLSLTNSAGAIIGGTAKGEGNVVVGSPGAGIYMANSNNTVLKGNLVGITPNNLVAGNISSNVLVNSSNNVMIGGAEQGSRNIISGANGGSQGGIGIYGTSSGAVVQGNYIGTDIDGTAVAPNYYGISIFGTGVANTLIGGVNPGEGNILSGNIGAGVYVKQTSAASNTQVFGNTIGLGANGSVLAGAKGNGVWLYSANGVRVGGSNAGEENIISGNTAGTGVTFTSASGGSGVAIQGNLIGFKADGETAAPNVYGVNFLSVTDPVGSYLIGGSGAGQGNYIAYNTSSNISITGFTDSSGSPTKYPINIYGNTIGLTKSGKRSNASNGIAVSTNAARINVGGVGAGEGNLISGNSAYGISIISGDKVAVRGNSIVGNGGIGLDLRGVGGVPDDNDAPSALDADTGGNNLQNFPRRSTVTKCDGSTETKTVL